MTKRLRRIKSIVSMGTLGSACKALSTKAGTTASPIATRPSLQGQTETMSSQTNNAA